MLGSRRLLNRSLVMIMVTLFFMSTVINSFALSVISEPSTLDTSGTVDTEHDAIDRSSEAVEGDYYYTCSSGQINMCVNFPNQGGQAWASGRVIIRGSDGSSCSALVGNFAAENWKITWTGIRPGVRYYFEYVIFRVGSVRAKITAYVN